VYVVAGEGLTDWTIVPEQPGNNSGQSPYPRASSPSIAPAQLGKRFQGHSILSCISLINGV
jgi:hypothetical protein